MAKWLTMLVVVLALFVSNPHAVGAQGAPEPPPPAAGTAAAPSDDERVTLPWKECWRASAEQSPSSPYL